MNVYIPTLFISVIFAAAFSRKQHINHQPCSYTVRRFPTFRAAFLALLPLTLVAVLRWDVGHDSIDGGTYHIAYELAAQGVNSRQFEWGYFLLSSIFAKLNVPYFWLLFVISLFYMVCAGYSIYKISVAPALSVITFVLLMSFFDSFSALRQSIAQAICVVALANWMHSKKKCSSRKRDLIYLILVGIAILFHRVSLLYLFLFFCCKKNLTRNGLILVAVFLLMATPFLRPLLGLLGDTFSGNKYVTSGFASSYTLLSLVIFLLCLWRYYDILVIDRSAVYLINQSLFTFIIMLNSSALVQPYRLFDALKINYIFTIPFIVKSFKDGKEKFAGLIVGFLLVGMMLAFFLNSMIGYDSHFKVYQSILDA